MKKTISLALILTLAASLSFADSGEQAKVQAQPQVESQPAPQAPVQAQAATQAQEPGRKVITDVNLRTGAQGSVKGKVESVTPADLLTKPRSSIVIVDEAGKTVNFVVKALAVVYDATGQILTLNNVKPSDNVQVNYITKADKSKEAASIKVLKQ